MPSLELHPTIGAMRYTLRGLYRDLDTQAKKAVQLRREGFQVATFDLTSPAGHPLFAVAARHDVSPLARAGIPGEPPRKARLTRPVELAPSDPSWPSAFEEEARRIQATLGGAAVRVDHVGSTAIPGLAAKPVIDIQVSVRSMEPRRAYVEPLVALGYRHVGDPASPDHEYFSQETEGERSHQVHVCLSGSEWERRHLLFRDELRRNPDLAAAYERLKRELAEAHPRDVYAYVEGKTDFVRSVEDRVLGAPPPVGRAAAGGHDGEDPRG